MVFLDPAGMPLKYDQFQILKDIVGTAACRIHVDRAGKTFGSWHPTGFSLNTADEATMDDKWRRDICAGADHVLKEAWVTARDPHFDAKLWPHLHPWGSGSLYSERGSGGIYRLVQNRLLIMQSGFRQNNLYAFWFLNRCITKEHQTAAYVPVTPACP